MAKIFEEPSFELLEMSKEDVLTASGTNSVGGIDQGMSSGDPNPIDPDIDPFA